MEESSSGCLELTGQVDLNYSLRFRSRDLLVEKRYLILKLGAPGSQLLRMSRNSRAGCLELTGVENTSSLSYRYGDLLEMMESTLKLGTQQSC